MRPSSITFFSFDQGTLGEKKKNPVSMRKFCKLLKETEK